MSLKKKMIDIIRVFHINWMKYKIKSLVDLKISEKVIIIAPHPDDEVIGCGGLISRFVSQGKIPYILFLTGGGSSHKNCCDISEKEVIKNRRLLTSKALSILGVPSDHIFEINFPDGSIPPSIKDAKESELKEEITKLKEFIFSILTEQKSHANGGDLEGASIFIPHWGEGWPDHINAASLVKEILKEDFNNFSESSTLCDSNNYHNIQKVSFFEYCVWMPYYNVWHGLDWENAFCLKLTPEEHKNKLEAINAYIKPLAPCGNPWSGVLPKLFIKANQGVNELYFKV